MAIALGHFAPKLRCSASILNYYDADASYERQGERDFGSNEMALRKNPFTRPLKSLLDHLTELLHVVQLSDHYARQAAKEARMTLLQLRQINTASSAKHNYYSGCGLGVVDLFTPNQYRWLFDTRSIANKRLASVPFELSYRNNSIVLVDIFESFERYLKAIYGPIIRLAKLPIKKRKSFLSHTPNAAVSIGTPRFFELYALFECKSDCEPVLSYLSSIARDTLITQKYRRMSFSEFFRAISFCRHLIVHSRGRMDGANLSKLNRHQRKYIEGYARVSKLHRDRMLLPDREAIDECIEYLAGFAAAIYRVLTEYLALPRDWGLQSWREWQMNAT